ncbi:MAG: AAA family ATPase [Rhodopirellula sp.]|nr:AAA family ATPase [Rhodopirellula sp.]
MKLERIHIERFGAWQNLDLPVDSEGISVYYGPNEAGKSTLMRFVRGVLYGFRKGESGRPANDDGTRPWGGALQVRHEHESWMIRRSGHGDSQGLVTSWPVESAEGSDSEKSSHDGAELVSNLVSDVSESVYENIFAIGLYELQELATLESKEVAEHIYSLSLGLDGQQLLRLIEDVRQERDALLDVQSGEGKLADLYEQVAKIDAQLEQVTGQRRKHAQLSEEQERWEESIVEFKQRQQGLEHQLHGHEYMEQVHEPWQKVRGLEKKLDKLPNLPDFPANGLTDLQNIEQELAAVRGRRNALLTEARQLVEQRKQIAIDPLFHRYGPALQAFVDQRDWIVEMQEFVDETDEKSDQLRDQLTERLQELGADWTEERLRAVDTSHLAGNCLTTRAREFRELSGRTQKMRERYRKLSKKFHRRQERLTEARTWHPGISITQAIEQTKVELTRLEDLSRLRIRELELTQRRIGLANQLNRLQLHSALPQWVNAIFIALGIAGLSLGLIGILTGIMANGFAGLTYALLGAFCTGTPFALKRHFEGEFARKKLLLDDEIREQKLRIKETREAISCIAPSVAKLRREELDDENSHEEREDSTAHPLSQTQAAGLVASRAAEQETSTVRTAWQADDGKVITVAEETESIAEMMARVSAVNLANHDTSHVPVSAAPVRQVSKSDNEATSQAVADASHQGLRPSWLSEADLLRQSLERLRELELMEQIEAWVTKTRPELVEMRHHLRDVQRDYGTARQDWCSHLIEQGLEETVEIDQAMWQRDHVGRAAMILQRIDDLDEDTQMSRRMLERFRKRVEEFGHRLQQWKVDYSDPIPVLDHWTDVLMRVAELNLQRRKCKQDARQRRLEASKFRDRIRRLESQRDAILVRGGAVSREEFQDRASLLERRFELEELLERARQELTTAASGGGQMAIVESDLENYDPAHNTSCIATIRSELDDLAIDIEDAFENLGRFKREIELLENDRSGAELRFEREQQLSELTSLAEEWFALAWSADSLEELRIEFEQSHQPPILARAKEYLCRLSGERYDNIWTPMGERTLCVDDADDNTLRIEHLSGGTREQLFLSIRLAMIEHFSSQGVELPIVLDDILVNFDEQRTRAAIEELLRQTGDNQQILFFTCHQHLAEMFRQRGVSTVMLPDRRALNDELKAG